MVDILLVNFPILIDSDKNVHYSHSVVTTQNYTLLEKQDWTKFNLTPQPMTSEIFPVPNKS